MSVRKDHIVQLLLRSVAGRTLSSTVAAGAVAPLHTSAATRHGSGKVHATSAGSQLSSGITTQLHDDVGILHLLTAKPSIRADLADMQRSGALARVNGALGKWMQQQRLQEGQQQLQPGAAAASDSAAASTLLGCTQAGSMPSYETLKALPAFVLQQLAHECQLQLPPNTSLSVQAAVLHEHLTALAHAEAEHARSSSSSSSRRRSHAVWVPQPRHHGAAHDAPAFAAAANNCSGSASAAIASSSSEAAPGAGSQAMHEGSVAHPPASLDISESSTSSAAPASGRAGGFSWGAWGRVQLPPGYAPLQEAAAEQSGLTGRPSESGLAAPGGGASLDGQARVSLWPDPVARSNPDDPYAPLPDMRHARARLLQDVKALLRRQGVGHMSPLDPAAVKLLRKAQLAMLAEDCGLPSSGKHPELVQHIMALLQQQQAEQQQAERQQGRGQQGSVQQLAQQGQQQQRWLDAMEASELQHQSMRRPLGHKGGTPQSDLVQDPVQGGKTDQVRGATGVAFGTDVTAMPTGASLADAATPGLSSCSATHRYTSSRDLPALQGQPTHTAAAASVQMEHRADMGRHPVPNIGGAGGRSVTLAASALTRQPLSSTGDTAVGSTAVCGTVGDPMAELRAELLRSLQRGRAAARTALSVHQVADWLRKAHAVDVVAMELQDGHEDHGVNVVSLGSGPDAMLQDASSRHGDDNASNSSSNSDRNAGSRGGQAGSSGADASDWVIVATATSQRHAYTCGQAVLSQVRDMFERCAQHLAAAGHPGVRMPRPQVLGGRGMDWIAVEAGPSIMVHVLTEPARHFYQLESLYRGPPAGAGCW